MILLSEMTTLEWILFIPGAILTVYLIFKLYAYIIAGLTKLSGKQLYVDGEKWADSYSFDNMLENDKKKIEKIKSIALKAKQRLQNLGSTKNDTQLHDINFIIKDKTTDKINKIHAIVELQRIGAITMQEFIFLKEEILNN